MARAAASEAAMPGGAEAAYPAWKNVANFLLALAVLSPSFLFAARFFKDGRNLLLDPEWAVARPDDPSLGVDGGAGWWQRLVAWGVQRPVGCVCVLFALNVDLVFWLISLAQRSTWLIDPYWTLLPPLIAQFYAMHPTARPNPLRSLAARLLLLLWSHRLTHSYLRRERWRWGWREDWRYAAMRRQYGALWPLLQLLLVYLLQHVLLVGVTLPLHAIHVHPAPLSLLDALAALLALAAISLAAVADDQLHAFVSAREHRRAAGETAADKAPGAGAPAAGAPAAAAAAGAAAAGVPTAAEAGAAGAAAAGTALAAAPAAVEAEALVLQEGVWAWSRHPNHVGELLFWWAVGLWGAAVGQAWTLVGAAVNTACMAGVSGMVEQRMLSQAHRRAAYQLYCSHTPMWLPCPGWPHVKVE